MSEKDRTAELLLSRVKSIKSRRTPYEPIFRAISEYMLFNRGDFGSSTGEGNLRNPKVFDATAGRSLTTIVSVIHSWLTTENGGWFRLSASDPSLKDDEQLNKWFEQVTALLHYIFRNPKSGFISQMNEMLMDWQGYGTGCLYIEEDIDDVIHIMSRHLSEVYIAENSSGMVDTVVRGFKYTARQCLQKWPDADKKSKTISDAIKTHPDDEVDIVQFVLPVDDYERLTGKSPKNTEFKFYSVYILESDSVILSESGYYEMPYLVPRADKVTGEVYGRSNAWTNLPDIFMVNAMSKSFIEAAQFATRPPMLISDDGVIRAMNLVPGGTIYGGISDDGTERVKPLGLGNNVAIGNEIMEQRRKAIREGFYVDEFLSREGIQPLTATEALINQENRLRLISPQIQRLWSECLTPLIERLFKIAMRRGMLPPAPVAAGTEIDFDVQYISPLATIQHSQDLAAVQRFLQTYTPFIQLQPDLLDNLDMDKLVRTGIPLAGLPLSVQRNEDDVLGMRQQREQQKQQEAQMAAVSQLADSASKLQKSGIPVA